jgi:FkbM family methyltransferase
MEAHLQTRPGGRTLTAAKKRVRICFNLLFHRGYPLYRPVYFLYKRFSDREKLRFLAETVRPGMTVLDIGANIGFYAKILSKLVGETGVVYAFEPEQLNFERMRANTQGLQNLKLVRAAVGSKTQKLKLYVSDDMNVDHHTYDNGRSRRAVEVDCVALDDYLAAVRTVDFVKIDVQGFDCEAIRGARELLKRSSNVKLLGEFWPFGLKNSGTLPSSYLQLLKDLGFSVEFLGLHGREGINFDEEAGDRDFYTDFVAIKK